MASWNLTVGLDDLVEAVVCALEAFITVLVWGAPGVGKTSIMRAVAAQIGKPIEILIGAHMEAVDIAGLPWVEQGRVLRAMFPAIQRAIDEPIILFLDEFSCVPPSVRAAFMRLVLERNAGGIPLHPQSVVICCANDPEHAPNAADIDAATGNRVCQLWFCPSVADVARWFRDGGPADAPYAADLCRDFGATLEVDPSLLQLEPPPASIGKGRPFGSPRAWELGLRMLAKHFLRHAGDDASRVTNAMLAGCVGEENALAYLTLRKVRHELPTISEIVANPVKAKVPEDRAQQIAMVGVVYAAAQRDLYAAWCYVSRMPIPEIAAATSRMLLKVEPPVKGPKSPWETQGKQALVKATSAVLRGGLRKPA